MIEYAATLLNRGHVAEDGKTAYERLKGKPATIPGLQFGERVLLRSNTPARDRRNKMDSEWSRDIFLGQRSVSGEFIVCTVLCSLMHISHAYHCQILWTGKCLKYYVFLCPRWATTWSFHHIHKILKYTVLSLSSLSSYTLSTLNISCFISLKNVQTNRLWWPDFDFDKYQLVEVIVPDCLSPSPGVGYTYYNTSG